MTLQKQVLATLDQVLGLNGRALSMEAESALLGAIPELDSMAVVTLLAACEDRFGITFSDDDIEGADFATVGSFVRLVTRHLPQ